MRSAQNIDQRITQNNFQITTSVLEIILVDLLRGRAKSSGCLSWPRFPSSRAKERFHLLRAHLEDGLVACCDCSRSKHLLSNTALLAGALPDFRSGGARA